MKKDQSNSQSRSEGAYEILIAEIQQGRLKPGTRIREVELAERFGISRTPIRDAILKLESDGLLVHEPRKGAVIKTLGHREVVELYEMREVLEGTAALHAAQHASDVEIAELEELNILMRDAAADPQRVSDINRQFHSVLYYCAHNRYLIDALKNLSNSIALLGGTTLQAEARTLSAYAEHSKIVDKIKLRDGQAAQEAAREHIRASQAERLKLLRELRLI